MLKRHRFHVLISLLVTLTVLVSGCLLSGTFVMNLSLNEMVFATQSMYTQHIDVTTNQTWQEHQDQIKDITDIGFALKIENNSSVTAAGEIYITDSGNQATPAEVKSSATVILTGISVAPNSTKNIAWSESYQYIRNLAIIKEQIRSGSFWVYALVDNAPMNLRVYDGALIVTFTAVP